MSHDGVLQIEGTSPGHAEAGASARSGGLTFRLIIMIETVSVFVAGLRFSAVVSAAFIVIGGPVFGIIKSVLGFRQFLLRGLDNVRGEWSLVTMAWNLKRMFALCSVQ
jgi:Transposase DDE domain